MVVICGSSSRHLCMIVKGKITTDLQTAQVFFGKNAKFLKFIPISELTVILFLHSAHQDNEHITFHKHHQRIVL